MSFYALVMDGKVLGFRENLDEKALTLAERTALVAWSGEPIAIYEVEGRMPQEADRAMRQLEVYLLAHPEAEPVSVVRAPEETEEPEAEDEPTYCGADTTGCYRRVDGTAPGDSGFFASVG